MASTEEHGWVRARLAAWRSGLLTDPAEDGRLDGHIARCRTCREAAMLFDSADPSDGHLPPGMIARWDRVRESLSGLERTMAREHLEECPSCREDLERLGFEPALAPKPAEKSLFEAVTVSTSSTDAAAGQPATWDDFPRESVRSRPRRAAIFRWALGGWAVAMTTAVIILAATRSGPRPGTADSAPGSIAPLFADAAPTLVLSSSRGEGGQIIETTDRTRSIILGVPDIWRFPADAQLDIEITSGGASLLRRSIRAGEVGVRDALVLTSQGPWTPGTYHILVRDAGVLRVEYVFDLRRTTGR